MAPDKYPHFDKPPVCVGCEKKLRLHGERDGKRLYGTRGQGLFCTDTCAIEFAHAAVRHHHCFKPIRDRKD